VVELQGEQDDERGIPHEGEEYGGESFDDELFHTGVAFSVRLLKPQDVHFYFGGGRLTKHR
jgi:hypothetical protein